MLDLRTLAGTGKQPKARKPYKPQIMEQEFWICMEYHGVPQMQGDYWLSGEHLPIHSLKCPSGHELIQVAYRFAGGEWQLSYQAKHTSERLRGYMYRWMRHVEREYFSGAFERLHLELRNLGVEPYLERNGERGETL